MDALITKRRISGSVSYYPLFTSYFWMIGGLLYYFLSGCGTHKVKYPLVLLRVKSYPKVLIIMSCCNEEASMREVISHLVRM